MRLFCTCTADRRRGTIGDPRDPSDGESVLCARGIGDFDCGRNCELRLWCSLAVGLSAPSTKLSLAGGICGAVAWFPSSATRDDVCDVLRRPKFLPFVTVRWPIGDCDHRGALCLLVLPEAVSPTNLKLGVVASQRIPSRTHAAHCGFPSSHYH